TAPGSEPSAHRLQGVCDRDDVTSGVPSRIRENADQTDHFRHETRLLPHFADDRVLSALAELHEPAGQGRHAAERFVLATDCHELSASEDEPIDPSGVVV